MLVLSRKKGESIMINDQIEVTILGIDAETIKIGIKAPKNIEIHRKEIFDAIQSNNQDAVASSAQLKSWLQSENKN